ncbi:hypothetical protein [Kribbella sp. NPDC006257]|uniref:hypothetical protein n=1 Tax=Kribbella sp. NPDC006257 TaxID=3156738 RepID=UPI0033A1BF0C
MPSIGIPGHDDDPWMVSKRSFRALMEEARDLAADQEEWQTLMRAEALDGLHFQLLDEALVKRLTVVVRAAALSVRARLLASFDDLDQRDREFTEYLRVLIQWLDVYIAELAA